MVVTVPRSRSEKLEFEGVVEPLNGVPAPMARGELVAYEVPRVAHGPHHSPTPPIIPRDFPGIPWHIAPMAHALSFTIVATTLTLWALPCFAQQQYYTRPFGSGTITTGPGGQSLYSRPFGSGTLTTGP